MAVTFKEVRNARPGRLSDGKGLYLLTKPTAEWARINRKQKDREALTDAERKIFLARPAGASSWVLRVQYQGNRRDFGLGGVTLEPVASNLPLHKKKLLTLSEAREKARIGRDLAKNGINPVEHWKADGEEVPPPTFEEAAREYHKQIARGWRNGKHKEQWLSTLDTYAFPLLGSMRVDAIDAADAQRVLLPIWLAKPETARRVKQRLGAVLDYAHGKGWRATEAPTRALGKLMGGIKQPQGGNFAAMPYKDLPAFMAKLVAGEFSVGRLALQFVVLTVPRSGELRKATWRQFDLEAAEWAIPPANTKGNKPHIVPLVPAAVDILKQLQELFGGRPDDLVFPGLKGQMSDATLSKAFRVNGGGDYTVHGLRSTFRDWAADHGFNNDWAEAALAHSVAGQEGKTVAAYKRTTFFEQRRDRLMPAWAAFALGNNNVVSLAERRA